MSAELPRAAGGRSARDVAVEACRVAGDMLRRRFGGAMEVTHKGRGNMTTDVDRQVQDAVLGLLRREFPAVGSLAEEAPDVEPATEYYWVVDPLDGTRNFATGVPFFSVVVALARRGEVVLGLTYDPMRDELFLAERGGGATLNGKPISVSRRERLEQCTLGFDLGYDNAKALTALQLVQRLWPGMQTIRIMGSSALGLAYAAAGRIDLYFHHALSPWDVAAGLVLAPEAGGVYTDKHGGPAGLRSDGLIVSNRALHAEFLRVTEGSEWARA